MSKIKTKDSVLGMEKSMTDKQIETANVDKVCKQISGELKSINSVIASFKVVAKKDSFANLMLETICANRKEKDVAPIDLDENVIKKYVIKAYPYKAADKKTMLKKDGKLFKRFGDNDYSADLIRKAYYGIVRPQKDVVVIEATEEQIAAANQDKAEKAAASQDKRKAEKDFIERLMNASSADLTWAIVQEYKAKNQKTESTESEQDTEE